MEEHAREDIARRAGTAVVYGIPTFVGAGIVWHFMESWIAVIAWVVIAVIGVGGVVAE